MEFEYGAVGFLMRERWFPRLMRWLFQSRWDRSFVVYSRIPEPRVLVAGLFGVRLVQAQKIMQKGTTVVMFEPSGWRRTQVDRAVDRAFRDQVNRSGLFGLLLSIPAFLLARLRGKARPAQRVPKELILQYMRGGEGAPWEAVRADHTTLEDLFVEISSQKTFGFQIQTIG